MSFDGIVLHLLVQELLVVILPGFFVISLLIHGTLELVVLFYSHGILLFHLHLVVA